MQKSPPQSDHAELEPTCQDPYERNHQGELHEAPNHEIEGSFLNPKSYSSFHVRFYSPSTPSWHLKTKPFSNFHCKKEVTCMMPSPRSLVERTALNLVPCWDKSRV